MPNDIAVVVERLALLELRLADEKRAHEATAAQAATLHQAVTRLGDQVAALEAQSAALAVQQQQAAAAFQLGQTWLGDVAKHLVTVQQDAHGWAVAEQEARTVLEKSVWDVRGWQDAALQEANGRPPREAALRAELLALGYLVEDLAAAVFPERKAP